MAKDYYKKAEKYPYPSQYGSHESMTSTEYKAPYGFVVCVDENGPYITKWDCLDNGLADFNRYRNDRNVPNAKSC